MNVHPHTPITDETLAALPAAPGVYLMKDAAGAVIYVGKAASLRARVRSYFRGGDGRPTVQFLLNRVRDIECVVTTTESEAVLLENTLIKKHNPRYNMRLRSDVTFVSLRIDPREDYPRFEIVRRRRKDGAVYLGPYASAKAVRKTLQFVYRVFPLRQCSDNAMCNRGRPCILFDMGLCLGPCTEQVSRDEYAAHVRGALLLLTGKREDVVRVLKEKMAAHSAQLEFEKAAAIRDKLAAINATVERQRVAFPPGFDADVIAHHAERGRFCFAVLSYRDGMMNNSQTFVARDHGLPLDEMYNHFITQYYDESRPAPPLVLAAETPGDAAMLRAWLEDLRGGACEIRQPQRGEKARTVEIAEANAREQLARALSGERATADVLEDLQRKLHLPRPPARIECYDISTLQGADTVGSRVVFADGQPAKADYRRYKIRDVEGTDDFASMRELLTRRFRRLVEEQEEPPDLVIIDGGLGQLAVAVQVLEELGLSGVPLAGLAKSRLKEIGDEERREKLMEEGAVAEEGDALRTAERLFLPGRKNPVLLKRNHPALYLVQRIRDEAHRFAITYHKTLRQKSTISSSLDSIPGVGPARRKALLRHFGSLSKIKEATIADLTSVPTISPSLAAAIHSHLAADSRSPS